MKDNKKNFFSRLFNDLNDNEGGGAPPPGNKGDWNIPAGEKGDKLARSSIPVKFLGTVVQFQNNPLADAEENKKKKEFLEKQAERNAKAFEEAIAILSQSETGRYLLEELTNTGYQMVFDDRRTGARGAGGLCDSENKLIVLRSSEDPEYIALVIGHEAVHALQNTKYNMFPSSQHKPETGIRLSFAIEADAYAQQTLIALELAHGSKNGPDNQVTYDGPLHQMRKRFPDIVKAAERTMTKEDALESGAAVAAAFESFYDDPRLRTFYEDAHTEWASKYAPMLMNQFPKIQKHFSKDVSSDWIKQRLRHRGKPYLKQHTPNIDFLDERHAGFTDVTREKIQKFYEAFKPDEKPPQLKSFGVHMKDAVAWVLGLGSDSGTVIVKGKDNNNEPPKPPLRPPPRRSWGFWYE